MLVLSRRINERIVLSIGGRVLARVKLVQIRGDKFVRLGFEAGDEVGVDREEVFEAKQRQILATKGGDPDV